MESIGKKSGQIVLIAVTGYILQYLCHLYLANLLSPSDYGDFAVAISMALLLAMLVELGAGKTIPKYIHYYQENQDISRISGLLRGYIFVMVLFSLLLALVGNALGYLDLNFTHKIDSAELHPLILALWFLPFMAVSNFLASLLKCFGLYVISEVPIRLAVFGLLLIFLWLFTLCGYTANDWSAILAFGIANMVVWGIYLFLTLRHVPHSYVKISPQYEWREWLNTSLPIMLSILFFMGMRQVDLFMIELLSPNEASAGYFSAASQTAQGILIVYTSLNLIYAPIIGKAMTENNAAVKKTLCKMSGVISCFCLPFLCILIFFGKSILVLFGPNYLQAYPTMLLLAVGLAANAIIGGYITFLQYVNKQKQVLVVQLLILFLAVGLNIIFIPRLGITGAGLSSAICLITMSMLLTFSAARTLSTSH